MAIIQGVTRFLDENSFNYDVAQPRTARGNYNFVTDGGAQGAFTIFGVTGTVLVKVFGVCSVNLTGAGATIELGIAGNTAALIAQTTAIDLDQYETWQDAVPEANPGDVTTAMAKHFVITNGADIILTVGTADLTAGQVDFYAVWYPLSTDGWVVGV